jgi:citrate synthase
MPIDKTIDYSAITPEVEALSAKCAANDRIDPELYKKYNVMRGLRDLDGNGVLTGLTEISDVVAFQTINGEKTPCEGKLYYRGVDVEDIVRGFVSEKRFGFEETTYLLLFGGLPNAKELRDFSDLLARYRTLPTNFVRDVIMKAPSADMMNTLARSVLTLASYDARSADNSLDNVLRQCLQLIALFPLLSVYGYQAYNHYVNGESLYIHNPDPMLSTAENILHTLRPDSRYTELEARLLDLALVLHAEHGGGNNSTFTTHVVTSSGTDTYSAITAALCSLKGPKHGGANIKVVQMFADMKENIRDWTDEAAIEAYLRRLLHKQAFDNAGLIYGMGHAVYSLSDPRARVFRHFVESLAEEKGRHDEYALYAAVERLAPKVIGEERRIYKGVAANIDFYSGFVYSMLDLPLELYTPIFAISRIAGWSAHRMEELVNGGKIIRPAYRNVAPHVDYVPLHERVDANAAVDDDPAPDND